MVEKENQRHKVGFAVIEEDGTVTAVVPDFVSASMLDEIARNFSSNPSFANGEMESAARMQAALYGVQIRELEDRNMESDRANVRRSWGMFRKQFEGSPIQSVVRDAYWSAYAGAAYTMFLKK